MNQSRCKTSLTPEEAFITYKVVSLARKWGLDIPRQAQTVGRYGEMLAYDYFREKELAVDPKFIYDIKSKHDLVVNGKRVEVKTARAQQSGRYHFMLTKNKINGVGDFDQILLILLEDIESEPIFILAEENKVRAYKGINSTKENLFLLQN